jgi:hypothetical protein
METINMHSIIMAYGDVVELDYKFPDSAVDELRQLTDWEPAHTGKSGINLTGPLGPIGLTDDKKVKHERNQEYNENLLACPSLIPFFDKFTELTRCRAVRMDEGSFFRPHRDAYGFNDRFRIFIPLNKTESHEYTFLYDDKVCRVKAGVPYILNTRKVHASFAMTGDIYHVIISLQLNEHNLKAIAKLLPNCDEW